MGCVFSTGNMRSLAALNGEARTSATVTPGRWVPWSRVTPADVYRRSGARDATLRHDIVTSAAVAVRPRLRLYPAGIERMAALGCDGVITDDPRLFHEE